ncbi:MAG: hypothetical protein EA356_12200 [Geminicoccaceae bacterium]|nr:MAG: hypothetical protein EA356_12200 [Geminicoccaceae bacterium]
MHPKRVQANVEGAFLLLKNDPGGMAAFDLSLRGFVQSFIAIAIVLPAYALAVVIQALDLPPEIDPPTLGTRLWAYGLQWAAFVLTAVVLAKVMRREAHFVAYVIASNWAAVVQIGIVLVVVLLTTLTPPALTGLLLILMTVGLLVYDYRVARIAFAAPGFDGVAVVAIQFLVSLLVQRLATW